MATVKPRAIAALPFALLLATAAPTAARAPDNPPAAAPAGKPAEPQWKIDLRRESLLREGQALAQQGRWKEALDKFREVNQIRSHPRVLLLMGQSEEQLGDLLKAREHYAKAQEGALATNLKREADDGEKALAALEPKIPRIAVKLSNSEDATFTLDSAEVLFDEEGWEVNPGKHTVSVSWLKRPSFQTEVVAKVGEVSTVDASAAEQALPSSPPKPPAPPAPAAKPDSGPPIEAIVLWASGGIGLVAGGLLFGLAVGLQEPGLSRAGIAVGILGVGAGISGFLVDRTPPPNTPPADPAAPAPKARSKAYRVERPSMGLQIAPSPQGFWAGVGGRF